MKDLCFECCEEREMLLKEEMHATLFKEVKMIVPYKSCYCVECGRKTISNRIYDGNLLTLYDTYRKKMRILPKEKIREVREKLHYTKEELSLALGIKLDIVWRYEKGAIPAEEHEEKYRKILTLNVKEKIDPLKLKKWLEQK